MAMVTHVVLHGGILLHIYGTAEEICKNIEIAYSGGQKMVFFYAQAKEKPPQPTWISLDQIFMILDTHDELGTYEEEGPAGPTIDLKHAVRHDH